MVPPAKMESASAALDEPACRPADSKTASAAIFVSRVAAGSACAWSAHEWMGKRLGESAKGSLDGAPTTIVWQQVVRGQSNTYRRE